MTRSRGLFLLLLSAFLVLPAMAAPVRAQGERVGEVVSLVSPVTETTLADGSSRDLAVLDPVRLGTRVATGPEAEVFMTLEPKGTLELGPEDRITIDRMTVDEATGRTEGTISLLVGRLKVFLSDVFGAGAEMEVDVDTPTATIGVKGTGVVIDVASRGTTVVWVLEGQVEVRAKAGGEALELEEGELTVIAPGRLATPPTPFEPGSGATDPGALPAPLATPPEDAGDPSLFPRPPQLDIPGRGDRPFSSRDPAAGQQLAGGPPP